MDLRKYTQEKHYKKIKISKIEFFQKATKTILILTSFIFLFLTIKSAAQESAVMDELAHIPAGYSYIVKQDIRLNPEHPPLLKDLSGIFLLPLRPMLPDQEYSFSKDINGEWTFGSQFLYQSGNDPDQILFFARLAPILLSLAFLLLFFYITRKNFGKQTAFLSLFLFAFSPTILAHSRYVATDIAAAFAFFVSIFFFLKFLKEPNKKNIITAGLIFGLAQLFKFSLIFLIPYFIIITFLWSLTFFSKNNILPYLRKTLQYLVSVIAIFFIGYVFVVWPAYKFHTLNYPAAPTTEQEKQNILYSSENCKDIEKTTSPSQFRDIFCQLRDTEFGSLAYPLAKMSDNSLLRPYSEYIFGALLAKDRIEEGGKNFFLGEVSTKTHLSYFPTLYFLKEPLALHILAIIVLLFLFSKYSNKNKTTSIWRPGLQKYTRENFTVISISLFIVLYLLESVLGNLNIGIRHILPIYPFVFILVSFGISKWLSELPDFEFSQDPNIAKKLFSFYGQKIVRYLAVFLLLFWYITSSLSSYPNFLSYFNETVAKDQGYKYVTDSNLDWGQSLKELTIFVKENNIEKLQLDYFGGGSPEYYLKDKYIPYTSYMGEPKGWFAVSAQLYTLATGTPDETYQRKDQDSYIWLRDKEPTAIIGGSILIFHF